MDGFSVASLTSLCTGISNRAAVSSSELRTLVATLPRGGDNAQLYDLSFRLSTFGTQILKLERTLKTATVISQPLQRTLGRSLEISNETLAVVSKQLMRLQQENIHLVDWRLVGVYNDLMEISTALLDYFIEFLKCTRREEQDSGLKAETPLLIAQTEELSRLASDGDGLLLDRVDTPDSSQALTPSYSGSQTGNDEPPPYTDTQPSNSQNGTAQAGPSSGGGFMSFSSLSGSLKALASGLRAAPEPLVCALCEAVVRGDLKQIEGLLSQGANINGRNENGHTPLHCAIIADRASSAKFLLSKGAEDKSGWSSTPPLFIAASAGSIDVARVFMLQGANVHAKNISGQPYFVGVVAKQNLAGVRFLLQSGANANTADITGQSVLAMAVKKGDVDIVGVLLQYGANPNGKDITGSSVLSLSADKDGSGVAELLLTYGASPNSKSLTGTTVLCDAISKRRLDLAKKLLERGANGNIKDLVGQHVLVNVIKDGRLSNDEKMALARLLMLHGAPVSAADMSWNVPALYHAMELESMDMTTLLLQRGALLVPVPSNREPPLITAIHNGRMDQVKALLLHGANPNQEDSKGWKPMMAAHKRMDNDMMKLLKKFGAIPLKEADIRTAGPSCVPPVSPHRPASPPPVYDFVTGK